MNNKIIYSIFASILLLFGLSPIRIFADEIIITGNGSTSENTVTESSTSQTNITQTNTSDIQNNVTTNSDTGNNEASDNTGNTSITTGDASTSTEISNQANYSEVNQECCDGGENSTIISGNGAGSVNTTNQTTNNTTTSLINQTAIITNIISGYVNTGNNTASGNTGNVSIYTGNITSLQSITNGWVNLSSVTVPNSKSNSNNLLIKGNGAGSFNEARLNEFLDTVVIVNNTAVFLNEVTMVLNTGGNKALVNVGNVDIKTGDIIARTEIKNMANVSKVEVKCCDKNPENPPANPPSSTSTSVSSSTSNSSGGSSSSPQVQAAAIGKVLPATGGYWAVIFLLGNFLLLFFGMFLRLRSGRSPSLAYAC